MRQYNTTSRTTAADRINARLLAEADFLAPLDVAQFANLPKRHLFAEIARLDKLLAAYPELIDEAYRAGETAIQTSLEFCESASLDRYNSLRQLCVNWRLGN
jgi:hypothetical protein